MSFNLRFLTYGLAEAKFLKSPKDFRILFSQKMPFFVPRFKGNMVRRTTVPPSLQIEPTNNCNLRCLSCPRDQMKREKGFMPFDLFTKIIDDAAGCRVKRIHFYLHGEPLLHPQIVEMIAYIKKTKMGITITTNGMALDQDKITKLLRAGLDSGDYFTVSVFGGTRETHEKLMVNVKHEKVKENIRDFVRLRTLHKVNGPVIETIMYVMPENKHDEKAYRGTWDGIVDHVKIAHGISNAFRKWGMHDVDLPVRMRTCPNLWERLTVCWNGDVTLCCMDVNGSFLLGNLKENTIQEMWDSPKLDAVKEMHRAGKVNDIELCKYCDY